MAAWASAASGPPPASVSASAPPPRSTASRIACAAVPPAGRVTRDDAALGQLRGLHQPAHAITRECV